MRQGLTWSVTTRLLSFLLPAATAGRVPTGPADKTEATTQDVGKPMDDPVRIALVGDYPGELVGDIEAPLRLGEEHHPAVRRDPSAIERGAHPSCRKRDRGFADSPVEEGVLSELVSEPKFPASWENTGNFVRRGLRVRLLARNPASNSMVCEPIPYASEQGIYFGLAGN